MTDPIIVGVALRDDDHAPLTLGRELARFTGAPLALVHVYYYEPIRGRPAPEYDAALRELALSGLEQVAETLRGEPDVTLHAVAAGSPVRGLHDAGIALDA